jgi:lipopolysaccharide/colanic/teichoic acid biosynthesis glycosyltransferase
MIKRTFDLIFSLLGVIVLSPLLLVISLWVKLDSRGPVFFRQKRMGLFGKPFPIYKFRSMTADAESKGRQITSAQDPRVTRSGRFLRRTKLDELPQLFNVILGDMSIVGPRPEVPKYAEMFRADYELVLSVRPGITDFATIEFRDEEEVLRKFTDPEEGYVKEVLPRKIELYKKYLREQSLPTDLKLIVFTVLRILHAGGGRSRRSNEQ